jgi:predicted Zn-dependent protease
MIRPLIRSLFALSFLFSAAAFAQNEPSAKDDLVLQAMQTEMQRSKSQLKLEGMSAPYYIDYRVVDAEDFIAESAYGALRTSARTRFRLLRVVVRVGDYKQDSFIGEGEGAVELMPLDADLLALRHQIWIATDKAYKSANEALTAKQAQLKQLTIDQPVDDFAHADPVKHLEPLVKLDVDPAPWLKLLQDVSALYKNDPKVESFDSSLKFQAINRYFVNSEGTVLRDGRRFYEINVSGSTQAEDGMRLDRSHGEVAADLKDLTTPEKFMAQGTTLLATLKQLREAPLAEEEYRGPVLFSADAASSVFHDLVGENVLGLKPALGQPARTKGAYATSYQSRILPDFVSVVDDPGQSAINGKSLFGHYEFDDEGVKATKVSVVENGKLVNYLLGREPIRGFLASNGHGRAKPPSNSPGPSLGNLIFSSTEAVSREDLKKKLVALCQQRELPFGYYVETLGPQRTPRLLYKVWAKDGREELVRGANFGDLDTRTLRNDLVAFGNDVDVSNYVLNVPHSVVNPSILFDELEVKRANQNKEKLPDYPAPPLTQAKSTPASRK